MATFIFVNQHEAEQCGELFEEAQQNPHPSVLDGTALPCLCPSGTHSGYFVAETDDPEPILAGLPPKFRAGTRYYQGLITTIGKDFPVA